MCEHKTTEGIYECEWGKYKFNVDQCTWDCQQVIVFVTYPDGVIRDMLQTTVAPYQTNKPELGNSYYWKFQGLSHSTPVIDGLQVV